MRQNPQNVSPMSNEGRNAYVIRHLTDALLKLLHKKPLQEISISELCAQAGVGRASFYRNFDSKEDILKTYLREIFQSCMEACENSHDRNLSATIRILFSHYEEYRDFYSLLNERDLIYMLKDEIITICGPRPEASAIEAYSSAFAAYSLYGWTEVWFQRGMKENSEEIASMFQGQGF